MKVEKIINKDLKTLAEDNQKKFINNKPFSHIMFENFFDEGFLTEILNEFPDLDKHFFTEEEYIDQITKPRKKYKRK